MFTGIVEEIGTIESVSRSTQSARLRIKAGKLLEDAKTGDSICTSGVCLTISKLSQGSFEADVMAETMRKTKLGALKSGSKVNLERALQLTTRLGGHLVSGHIDGTGTLLSAVREDHAVWLTIAAEPDILRYIVKRGSVAVDGVSLTAAKVSESNLQVSVIPHTQAETTLLTLRTGEQVNLECDIIAKYVERLFPGGTGFQTNDCREPNQNRILNGGGISESFLKINGF